MFKIIKYLLYVLALIVIGASVYIATLPSKFEHTYSIPFNKAPKQMIKNKLLQFEQWKKWAIKDTSQFKVLKSKDPLQSVLQSSLTNKQEFKLENEQITDSTIVQKLYTQKERTEQVLIWNFGNYRSVENLTLQLKEELSFNDKLYELLQFKNEKRAWLLNLENRLAFLQHQVAEKASDYTISDVKKSSFGPYNYVYLTGSGNINHLEDQTHDHIIKLEQFLAEKHIQASDKPFIIYNNDSLNKDVIFSTALPIREPINIDEGNPVRYNSIPSFEAFYINVNGNPKNIKLLWKNLKETKELTLTTMTTNRYLIHEAPNDILNKKQRLVWEIQQEEKMQQVTTDSLEYEISDKVKDSLSIPE